MALMDNSERDLQKILYDGLNQHGFLFQERCAQILEHASTGWRLEAKEYPVSIASKDTRIDIVLRDAKMLASDSASVYAIVECKRVNTSYTRAWLFGKQSTLQIPLVVRLSGPVTANNPVPLGTLRYSQTEKVLDLGASLMSNWWLEIGRDNNKFKSSPQPIEEALTQVCIGLSGLAREQEVQQYKRIRTGQWKPMDTYFLPIVVTNAPLYCSDYKLRDVDLTSGTIPEDKVSFGPGTPQPVPWILVNYGASRSIIHENFYESVMDNTPKDLKEYHTRSIYVVSSANAAHDAKGLEDFFSKLHF